MKNVLSIINLLKSFGTYVYTGNRLDDINLMMMEVQELHDWGLIMQADYLQAVLILRQEQSKLSQKKEQ